MSTEPLLLTVTEAARLASVSRVTAYRLVKSGEWPSRKIRGRLRVSRYFLERLARDAA